MHMVVSMFASHSPLQLSAPCDCTTVRLYPLYCCIAVLLYCCRQFFQEQYEALDASLFSTNRAVFPASTFTAEGFAWAVATVRSRLHAPLDADTVALVPLADAVRGCACCMCMYNARACCMCMLRVHAACACCVCMLRVHELGMGLGVEPWALLFLAMPRGGFCLYHSRSALGPVPLVPPSHTPTHTIQSTLPPTHSCPTSWKVQQQGVV
jgi:hypothetical protein